MTGPWVTLDISTAVQLGTPPWGEYSDGVIWGDFPDFYWPGLVLDPAKFYEFEVTWDATSTHDLGSRTLYLGAALTSNVVSDYANASGPYDFDGLYGAAFDNDYPYDPVGSDPDVRQFYVGPGKNNYDVDMTAGRTTPIFESGDDSAVSGVRYREVTFTTTTGAVTALAGGPRWNINGDADPAFPSTDTGDVWLYYPGGGATPLRGILWQPFTSLDSFVPEGAKILDWLFSIRAQGDGVALDPLIDLTTAANAGGLNNDYGQFGGGGADAGGTLPDGPGDVIGGNTGSYLLVYTPLTGGGNIYDPTYTYNALAADPAAVNVSVTVQAGDTAMIHYGLTSEAPTIVFDWILMVLNEPLLAGALPPLRQHPRSDGLGTSAARRLYPQPPSVQASNRRAGGYI